MKSMQETALSPVWSASFITPAGGLLNFPPLPGIMAAMNKIERVERTLQAKEVDRPPLSLWYHFGVQHSDGEKFAHTCLNFFEHYDFDFLKVMNDYFYPANDETIATGEDLRKITTITVEKTDWRHQLKALRIIGKTLENKAFFLDTVFDPWQTLQRNLVGENLSALMENEPQALLQALDVVTDNLISYCRLSLSLGTSGIFLSVPAAKEIMSREQFLRFCKPFVVKLLEAIHDLCPMNTAHIHGKELFFSDVLDLPAQVLSWHDRHPGCPSLEEIKGRFAGCVMGGIDQELVVRRTRAFLRQHVREAIAMGGRSRFFLAGGCSIPTWTDPNAIRAIVAAARQ